MLLHRVGVGDVYWWTVGMGTEERSPEVLGGGSSSPTPCLPDYQGANVAGIIPAFLSGAPIPSWVPQIAANASAVVLVVLDGLGWNQLAERHELAPNLSSLIGGPITTVAPSTTATALTSIATGLTPAEHGVLGYRMLMRGAVTNMLRWATDAGNRRHDVAPRELQPVRAFCGQRVPYVTSQELIGSSFSDAHLYGGVPHGYRALSSLPVVVAELVAGGASFVHAYYPGIDKIAHERGFGEFYDAELAATDHMIGDLLQRLPKDAVVVVTADHGQVEVGDQLVYPSDQLLRLVEVQSGEGRMRWFHSRPGAETELFDAALEEFGHIAWVKRRSEVIDEGWFGPHFPTPMVARLGDVVVAPFEPVSLFEAADTGPFELICRHGSLTEHEVLVPFIAGHGLR
ncbi:MAG: alkaline phosphatase family protein [Actinomycetota bacterium]|nr:alkaline phosphatase family protein [Actinomycetota bacterium]